MKKPRVLVTSVGGHAHPGHRAHHVAVGVYVRAVAVMSAYDLWKDAGSWSRDLKVSAA